MSSLTYAQLDKIKTGLLTDTDPRVIAALGNGADIGRDDTTLAVLCNEASGVDAWHEAVTALALFNATVPIKYDTLTDGKRASQDRMEKFAALAPLDQRVNKIRNVWPDIWGTTDSIPVLQALRRKATRAELYITPDVVGNRKTTNTVVGLDLDWTGTVDPSDLGRAFNPSFAALLAAKPGAIAG